MWHQKWLISKWHVAVHWRQNFRRPIFFTGEFSRQKGKFKIQKLKDELIWGGAGEGTGGGVSISRREEKKSKNCQISVFSV
jgi:hypothetical protein